jgi:hypothetical protein
MIFLDILYAVQSCRPYIYTSSPPIAASFFHFKCFLRNVPTPENLETTKLDRVPTPLVQKL